MIDLDPFDIQGNSDILGHHTPPFRRQFYLSTIIVDFLDLLTTPMTQGSVHRAGDMNVNLVIGRDTNPLLTFQLIVPTRPFGLPCEFPKSRREEFRVRVAARSRRVAGGGSRRPRPIRS
jgi:hypothetical protein